MILQQVVPLTFLQQVQPYIVAFIAMVVPAVGAWIVAQLKENHAASEAAAKIATDSASTLNQKADKIVEQTNGVNMKLQNHIDSQATVISASKDAQIALLTQQLTAAQANNTPNKT